MIEGSFKVLVPSWHPKQGLTTWENRNGSTVLQLHYSADPDKDQAWSEEAAKSFPGGVEGASWQQEMEIEAHAKYGTLVYPDVSPATHIVPYREIHPDAPRWRVIDPGYRDPLCCLWIAWDKDPSTGDKGFVVYREHYVSGLVLEQHAPMIVEASKGETYELTIIDPVAVRNTLEGGEASIMERLAKFGINCCPALRSNRKEMSIPALQNLLRLRENGHPLLKIMQNCPNTYRDVSELRYAPLTEYQEMRRNPGEKPLDVNDHASDCLIYFACTANGDRADLRRKQRLLAIGRMSRDDWAAEAEYAGAY